MESKVAQCIWFSHGKKILAWLDTSGGLQTWTGDSLQRLAPGQKVAGVVTELGCVPQVILGCHTTGRSRASRYDHFSYTENQSNGQAVTDAWRRHQDIVPIPRGQRSGRSAARPRKLSLVIKTIESTNTIANYVILTNYLSQPTIYHNPSIICCLEY